jgi:hypothetical protein
MCSYGSHHGTFNVTLLCHSRLIIFSSLSGLAGEGLSYNLQLNGLLHLVTINSFQNWLIQLKPTYKDEWPDTEVQTKLHKAIKK